MPERFQDVLDECIERALQGESVEHCLLRYPEQAAELEPLLRVALTARRVSFLVEPRSDFKDRTRYEVQSRLTSNERRATTEEGSTVIRIPGWVVATACLVLVLVVAGTGTVAAASHSMPGDTLYSVKTATEQVQWKLTFSQKAKARLQAKFAERRVLEIAQLAKKGRTGKLGTLTTRFEGHLARVKQLAVQIQATDPEDRERITELRQVLYVNMARDLAVLEVAEASGPESSRPIIAAARVHLMECYSAAIKALDELQGTQAGLGSALD